MRTGSRIRIFGFRNERMEETTGGLHLRGYFVSLWRRSGLPRAGIVLSALLFAAARALNPSCPVKG